MTTTMRYTRKHKAGKKTKESPPRKNIMSKHIITTIEGHHLELHFERGIITECNRDRGGTHYQVRVNTETGRVYGGWPWQDFKEDKKPTVIFVGGYSSTPYNDHRTFTTLASLAADTKEAVDRWICDQDL